MNKKNLRKIGLGLFLIALIGGSSVGIFYLYRTNNPKIIKPIPDPFIFNDGTRVESVEDWYLRRSEIKETLASIEYGHMPDRPDALNTTIISTELRGDGSEYRGIILTIIPKNETPATAFNVSLDLYVPEGDGPFPAIVKVSPDGTGTQVPINSTIVSRGYIFACYKHTDLDPDISGDDIVGPAQSAYPDYDWGTLAVWAWGAMRVADYLVAESWVRSDSDFPAVNEDALIVTGHSRRGKTALLAGAFDERFDMADPNGSGTGGASSYLVQGFGVETLKSITSSARYESWFQKDFDAYGGNEEKLPFDQHFLRALMAPRAIVSTDGKSDYWANPVGTQAMYEAAQPVFAFLNATEKNGIHFRESGHGFKQEDFETLLGFADIHLLEKNMPGHYYMTPYNHKFPINYEAPEINS